MTPCQGCPSLGAPLHGMVTISTLEATHNATLGWEWWTVCWKSCGSWISCWGICIQLFQKNWFLLHILRLRITMLDDFFEFIFDWMVSMQFFQVLSWSHSLLLPDDFLLSSYYLLFSSEIFLFTLGKTATLKWFTFTKLFEIPFLHNLINLSWQRKFRFETSFLQRWMLHFVGWHFNWFTKCKRKINLSLLTDIKTFNFSIQKALSDGFVFTLKSWKQKLFLFVRNVFHSKKKLEKTFIFLVGIKRTIVRDLSFNKRDKQIQNILETHFSTQGHFLTGDY